MLVVFGANGRTGAAVVRQARAHGVAVRPVVRDDRDSERLDDIVDVADICYADPDHPASLPPVLVGATHVVSCIDPRTAGDGCPIYSPAAGAHIIDAATEADVDLMLHLSVVGAYRWSPNRLNRHCFQLDRRVRQSPHRWSMLRVSCYHDEVIEAHVRPPDGAKPHRIQRLSRYTPVSREDVARAVLFLVQTMKPGRTAYMGGPRTFTSAELKQTIAPFVERGRGRRTVAQVLPPGDISVAPEVTWVFWGRVPGDTLEAALDPQSEPPAAPTTIYPKGDPGPHPADLGQTRPALDAMGPELRRVVHGQLVRDLHRLGVATNDVRLDFGTARRRGRRAAAHDGEMSGLAGVKAVGPDGAVLHQGSVEFLRDQLAEVFECWWSRDGIPAEIWDALDLGVKRRMAGPKGDAHFREDPRVQGFADGHEATRS